MSTKTKRVKDDDDDVVDAAHTAMIERLRHAQIDVERAQAELDKKRAARRSVAIAARGMTPPIPYRMIAGILGMTDAGVIRIVQSSE